MSLYVVLVRHTLSTMDDMEIPSSTAVIKLTENSETSQDYTEVMSAAPNSIRGFDEKTSDLHLESMHPSMQSLVMKGSVHSMESGSIITFASKDEKTIQVEQKDQDDHKEHKDQSEQGDQSDHGDQEDHWDKEDHGDHGDQEDHGDQKDQKKARMLQHEYICVILLTFLCMSIPFIWYHLKREDRKDFILHQAEDVQSNDSCPFWHLLGDNYCDDEANIPECGYDFDDCCKVENDRSICTDCLCYIPEDKKVAMEGQFIKNCLGSGGYAVEWFRYFGDGLCDLGFNTKEHYFDIGDCCLENPSCSSSTFLSTAADPFCEEDICIESNLFCIKEELGDGICQGHNNGPYCDHDLGDCCLATESSQTNCTCNCQCFMDDLYQIPWFLG